MGGIFVIWSVEFRFIVGGRVSGVVGDSGSKLGSEEFRGYVVDYLLRF